MLNTKCALCGTFVEAAEPNCVICGGDLTVEPVDQDQAVSGISPFGIHNAIRDTLSLFFGNLWLITKIVVVVVAPFEIVTALNAGSVSNQWELSTWSVLLGAACKVLVAPALIYSLLRGIQTGTPAGIQESYRWGLTKLVKLSICALIAAVLTGLGYMLCIIPGIIVMLSLAVVYPVAVLEKGSVNEIFRRSVDLTRGHRLEIFLVDILVGLVMVVPAGISAFAIASIDYLPVTIVGSIAADVFEQLFTVLALVLYLGLSQSPEANDYTILSLK